MSVPAYPDRVTTPHPDLYPFQSAATSATARFELRRGELRLLIISANAIAGRAGLRSGPLPSVGLRSPALHKRAIAFGDAPRSHEPARLGGRRFTNECSGGLLGLLLCHAAHEFAASWFIFEVKEFRRAIRAPDLIRSGCLMVVIAFLTAVQPYPDSSCTNCPIRFFAVPIIAQVSEMRCGLKGQITKALNFADSVNIHLESVRS
jgi:hypothetical protein